MKENIKSALQLLIDEGAIEEKKSIKMIDCDGNNWSYNKEQDMTLKVVTTEKGLDLLPIPNVALHRFDGEMVIGVNSDDNELLMFFLERGDEYDSGGDSEE